MKTRDDFLRDLDRAFPGGFMVGEGKFLGLVADTLNEIENGATRMTVTQPGDGAVARTVAARSMDELNARDYGAAGGGADATAAFAATMAAAVSRGISVVRIPPGAYTVSSAVEIPHAVRQVVMDGAIITRTTDAPVFTRFGSVDTVVHSPNPMLAAGRLLSMADAQTALYAQGDWVLLRANNLIPTQTAGSRVSVLRRLESVGTGVLRLDAPINRDMDNSLTVRKVFLAPPITLVGGTIESASQDFKKSMVAWFMTRDAATRGCRIGQSGGPGISLNYCVGGDYLDTHVYDLRDDEDNGHFGYGVMLAGACRGFRFTSGTASRCRHAITTVTANAGSVPSNLAGLLEFRGEPEDCVFGPNVWAYGTTNLAFDTHAEGFGITIIPHASGCFGGVNIRATNVHVQGGQLIGCRREGIRATSAPSNNPALAPIRARVSGTVIDTVAIDGASQSVGIRAASAGVEFELTAVRINGAVTGIEVANGTRIIGRDVMIDCRSRTGSVGVLLAGQNSDVDGLLVRNADTGISETVTGAGNRWSRYQTENVAVVESRVPTYQTGGRHNQVAGGAGALNDHEVPVGYFIPGRYYAPGGGVGSTAAADGILRASPFLVREATAFDRIGIGIATGAASAVVRLGIYADNGQGYPGALVVDAGSIDASAAGALELAISTTLQPGLYWLAAVSQGGAPTIRTVTTASQSVGSTSLATAALAVAAYIATGVTGALPANFPASRDGTSSGGRVVLRVA